MTPPKVVAVPVLLVRFAAVALVIVPPVPPSVLLLLIDPKAWLRPFRSSVPAFTATFCTPEIVAVVVTRIVFATPLFRSSVPAFTVNAPVKYSGLSRFSVPASDFVRPPVVPSRKPFTASVVPAPTVWKTYGTLAAVVSEPTFSAALAFAKMPPVVRVSPSRMPAFVKPWNTDPCTACPPPVAVMAEAVLMVRLFAEVAEL